jgi:hypothetical protein
MSHEQTDAKTIIVELPTEPNPWDAEVVTERLPRLPLGDLEADEAADSTAAGLDGVRVVAAD